MTAAPGVLAGGVLEPAEQALDSVAAATISAAMRAVITRPFHQAEVLAKP